jgi:3-deoxy-D-manno-octulosonic-acid transferase
MQINTAVRIDMTKNYYKILGNIHDVALFFGGLIYISSKLKDKRTIKNLMEKIKLTEKIETEKDTILVHSSSIGETKNALLFTKYLKEILSNTKSGFRFDIKNTVFTDTAKSLYSSVYVLPLPLFNRLKKFLPENLKLTIFYEGDLWPGYIIAAKEKGAKILVVSGRISKRSSEIIKRTPLKYILSEIDGVFASSEEYAERFKEIGIKRVFISKDLKNLIFLEDSEDTNEKEKETKNKEIKNKIKAKMKNSLIGISTRGNKEIEFLLETQKILGNNYILFIAPRHNFDEAENFLKAKNVEFIKFSDNIKNSEIRIEQALLKILDANKKVVLIDTYGIVDKILSYFSFSFVGGSILPIGGHNVLEPISKGVPVSTGKHIWNISEKEELVKEKVLFIVDNPNDLAYIMRNSKDEYKERVREFVNKRRKEIFDELKRIAFEIERLIGK